jgi:hypothetical protein
MTAERIAALATLVALQLLEGCGGSVSSGAPAADAGDDASTESDVGTEAMATQCQSPDGFAVCGGTSACPDTATCGCVPRFCDAGAGLCANDAAVAWNAPYCFLCADGDVCVLESSTCGAVIPTDLGDCYPYEVGALFAQNGASDQVWYTDYSSWTGEALPDPETCPTFGTFRICGGNCGGCNSGEVCTGRSPLHPYGVCIATSAQGCSTQGTTPCTVGSSCFRYTVQPAAQVGANGHGVCLPTNECQDMAANLPGGGTCE